jgi:hypothetical protein
MRSCSGWAPNRAASRAPEVRRIITDIDGTADIVGFTIAEFIPRQVMHLQQLLSGFPLISGTTGGLTD